MREHLRRPFTGAVCTLGRQRVVATYDQVVQMMHEEGYTPCALGIEQDLRTNIPSWQHTPAMRFTSDVVFFKLLGVGSLSAIDISDYERADIIWDLNRPVPEALVGRFDLVLDGGTVEHVFDVAQAVRNVNRLLRPGGRAIHLSPTSNYIDHGYYQLSPIVFRDYYAANGFPRCKIWLGEHVRPFATTQRWRLYEHTGRVPVAPFGWLRSNRAWGTLVVAEKGPAASVDVTPIQGCSADRALEGVAERATNRSLSAPAPWRAWLEPRLRANSFVWQVCVRAVLLGRSVLKGPTNHRYVGKL